jgi:hypothetical protein
MHKKECSAVTSLIGAVSDNDKTLQRVGKNAGGKNFNKDVMSLG